jgi:2-polyprenyl-6-methoxyphenol hydroxylase-like FAD-dependent oxidoreductase
MEQRLKIVIVGAGIGGLTAALALRRRGLEAEVYERAPALSEVGAGIWIPPNAMQVYERLGVDRDLLARSLPLRAIEVGSAAGEVFQRVELGPFRREFGFTTQSVHRAVFQRCLADHYGPGRIHFGRECAAVDEEGGRPRVTFADGTIVEADVVLGADGLRSRAREYVLPGVALRDSGQTCFRGVARLRLPDGEHDVCREVWGDRHRFGYSAVDAEHVYWFAPVSQPFPTPAAEAHGPLAALYADFPARVREILAATDPGAILRTDLCDFAPIDRWHRGVVALLGDAAHATTPNLGQGAAQAAESAYVLARALATHDTVAEAFEHYARARMEKAHHVTNTAWSLGRAAHLPDGLLSTVRDLALKATPQGYQDQMVHRLYALGY